jgi:putative redox protein
MVTLTITYQGALRCRVVHDPSGSVLTSDAPLDNQGRGESFSPTDLVASGLGCCMTTIMGIVARRDGIALEGAQLRVEKHMTASPPRKIARLAVAFSMPAGIAQADRIKLERAAHTCPVALSLHPDIAVQASFSYPD